ncbi:MAG: endonuclease/exonuclease/phosphatase family protein [Acidimicrobiia bacterium]|nr:endonuclease/exonuclease/phosphatase family protein [Acidimicrobiia bacterium]
MLRTLKIAVVAGVLGALLLPPLGVAAHGPRRDPIRFATFNASLNRPVEGQLRSQLEAAVAGTVDAQLQAVLDIVAINDPDVLLINEFDTGVDGEPATVALFAELAGYDYFFTAPSNTGVPSGFDLDNNGSIGGGGDAFGFGAFPGQFGMAVFSRYPIDVDRVRTFQTFRWVDMPGALLPHDPATGESWYSDDELDVVRLSSKSHWDVPIEVGRHRVVHFLVSHPTPPVFDGPEDRNGTRNFDEIRFWADYIRPGRRSRYIYDDNGQHGGLRPGARFVIAGDQNSDPLDGDSIPGAIQQLLDHPRVNDRVTPSSEGAVEAALLQGGANATHLSDPAFDTADFADSSPGNLRADYVLPSRSLDILNAGVFWPRLGEPGSELTGTFPFPSSDHRLVYVDIRKRGR